MGFKVEGLTGTVAEVDADNALITNLGKNEATAGYAIMMSEKDSGSVTGAPYVTSPEVSEDYRLRVGIDTLLLNSQFNGATGEFNRFTTILASTGTVTYAGGFVVLATPVTTATAAYIRSYQSFPVFGASQTWLEWSGAIASLPVAGQIIEIGAGILTTPATVTSALSDGVCFRYTGADLIAVVNFNGNERTSNTITRPTATSDHKYSISITNGEAEFWIDDVLVARLMSPSGFPGVCASRSLPVYARCYNVSSAIVQSLSLSSIVVSLADYNTTKPWAHQMAGMGLNAINAPLANYTSNWVNSTAPVAVTPTNLAAGYATLGGKWTVVAASAAIQETDLVLFAYLNPIATATVNAKTLYITGISLNTWNTGAVIGITTHILQWGIGVGATAASTGTPLTAISLAVVADTALVKQARRFSLGCQGWAAAAPIGTLATPINNLFETPLVVNPGEYVHIFYSVPIGTTGPTMRGVVGINAYWE